MLWMETYAWRSERWLALAMLGNTGRGWAGPILQHD